MGLGKNLRKDNLIPKKEFTSKEEEGSIILETIEPEKEAIELDKDGIAIQLPGESKGRAAARRIKEKKAIEANHRSKDTDQVEQEQRFGKPTIGELTNELTNVQFEENIPEDEKIVESSELLIVFQLGKEEYALKIEQVKEVVLTPNISSIPHEDKHILGVANVRGNVIAVIDLALRFGLVDESRVGKEGAYTLVIESQDYKVGLFVESVPNTISVIESEIESASAVVSGDRRDSYIQGIIKIDDRMIMLMDIFSFLDIETGIEEAE